MSELQILEEIENAEETFGFQNFEIDALKNLKETSQVFLKVNNFDLGKEPDFREYTEDQFISFFEKNPNEEILKKFDQLNVKQDFRSSMTQIYKSKNSESNIIIFFLPTSQQKAGVGIDVIKTFCKLIVLLDCQEGVIISEKQLTSRSRELLESANVKSFCRDNIYNIISYTDDTFINVVDHCLSPEVLKIYTGEDLDEFFKKNNLTGKELPRIMVTDPISKFYRARIGDVIMMKRKTGIRNTLVNQQIVFRTVVHSVIKQKK